MTDRDHFAAAALTGLISLNCPGPNQQFPQELCERAFRWADAMLRERDKTSVGVSATGAESGSTPDAQGFGRSNEYPCQPFDSAPTTDQERFVRFQSAVMNWISEATGFFHDDVLRTDDARDVISDACSRCWDAFDRIAYPTKNHDAAPAARATADRYVRRAAADGDSDRTDKAAPRPSEGTGETLSKAEIDALQHVVEDGKLVDLADYGRLRSLLVRLRPEWEEEADDLDRPKPVKDGDSDRSKPISDERLAALEELSALDQQLELEHGITGNPMIKPQVNNHPEPYARSDEKRISYDTTSPRNGALSGRETVPDPDSRVWETPCTPQPHATPTQGSVQGEGSFRDSRNANEPVAWGVEKQGYPPMFSLHTDWNWACRTAMEENGTIVPLFRQPPDWAFLNDEIARLRDAIRRLAGQDATLSVCDGNVTVTMDATLTDAEREAVEEMLHLIATRQTDYQREAHTLRKLLERLK